MTQKLNIPADKDYPYVDNDGFMVSKYFSNPAGVLKQLRK